VRDAWSEQPPLGLSAPALVGEGWDLLRQQNSHRVVELDKGDKYELPVPDRALAAMGEI
jgi:hypothetical protein